MRSFFRRFRRLQWKLTLYYIIASITAILTIEVILISALFVFINLNISLLLSSTSQQEAAQAVPFFVHNNTGDSAALQEWLALNEQYLSSYQPRLLAVVDRQGRILAKAGPEYAPPGTLLQAQLSPASRINLQRVLTGSAGNQSLVYETSQEAFEAVAAIESRNHTVLGAFVIQTETQLLAHGNLFWIAFYGAIWLPSSSLFFLILFGIAGIVFGLLVARRFVRRFRKLAAAAESWSRGNFSILADERSEDEIGQLAGGLNRMAEQLQNLLQARQQLATLEERNRLARDLHDSVKQQVFAISMQIGTTRALLERDPARARQCLDEAERLALQAQQELTALIRELRPALASDKSFVTALREFSADWERQTGIAVALQIRGEEALPRAQEDELFRIAQEALANVARHSQAGAVQIHLDSDREAVTLSISDNGCGFDLESGKQGIGLHSMRERAAALGSEIEIESRSGVGTSVSVRCERRHVTIP